MKLNLTFFDYQGQRIYSFETPEGFMHVCNKQVFQNVSDAIRHIKGEPAAPNPVVEAMAEQAQDSAAVNGDASPPEDDRLEE